MSSIMDTFSQLNEKRRNEAEVDVDDVIKELIDTDWSKDNEAQMKAVQLLKGIALSDDPAANAFMKKIDKFTSGMKVDEVFSNEDAKNYVNEKLSGKQLKGHKDALAYSTKMLGKAKLKYADAKKSGDKDKIADEKDNLEYWQDSVVDITKKLKEA